MITYSERFREVLSSSKDKIIHLVIIGTKPDIIKQAPLVLELKKQNKCLIVGHTGQHYDENLNADIKKVFNIEPDFNLNISGKIPDKIAGIIKRFTIVLREIKKRGKIIIPYVHGDTTTAFTLATAAFMNQIPVVHVEAGLRSFNPESKIIRSFFIKNRFNFQEYYFTLKIKSNWRKGSIEPFPEQFNTRNIASCAAIHCAPTLLNKQNLIEEGFLQSRIFVLGNTVSDSVKFALKKDSDFFKQFPLAKKGFIRFAIHRRENIMSRHRFSTIFETMSKLLNEGFNILWVSHNVNKLALKEYGLVSQLEKLKKQFKTFIYFDRLLDYDDNIAVLKKSLVNVTDSGSEQEEGNILRIKTVTARFGSDRPETIWDGDNILGPPVSSEILTKIILGCLQIPKQKNIKNLYGNNVSQKIVQKVDQILAKEKLLRWEHELFGFHKYDFWQVGGLDGI